MSDNIKYFHLGQTDSTNLEVVRQVSALTDTERLQHDCYVARADYQSAGRGQRGNSWESESGKNLLFSVMIHPRGVVVSEQFRLSQAMSIAICRTLNSISDSFKIKWPNDIYCGEQKVSGTVIETTLRGQLVERCILGVGVNVNQTTFRSDAPNPVSLCQLLGREFDCDAILREIMGRFSQIVRSVYIGRGDEVGREFVDMLIWRDGLHHYRDAQGDFFARLVGVEADGHLVVEDSHGVERRYMFKEVKHIFSTVECV